MTQLVPITGKVHHWNLLCKPSTRIPLRALPGQKFNCTSCQRELERLEAKSASSATQKGSVEATRFRGSDTSRRWGQLNSYQWKEWK